MTGWADKHPVVSVILVNHNDRSHLEDCLVSLASSVCQLGAEVIIVDNASTDGSRELLEGEFPEVRLIANHVNAGFAAANNQAVRESRGEHLLFLNTDTVLFPETVGFLLEELSGDPEVGAVGPALIHRDHSFQVSFGFRVSFFSQLWQKYVLNPLFKRRLPRMTERREVGWLSAAFLLTRRDVFEKAGCFDERFFIFFEDIDLCYRIRENGYRLIFLPRARAIHEGGATTSALKYRRRVEYVKSQLYFYVKHGSRAGRFLLRTYLKWGFRMSALFGLRTSEEKSLFRSEIGPLLGKGQRRNAN